jgi:hypothetical protein
MENPNAYLGTEGLDCCLAHVFGWGKTASQQAVRTAYAVKIANDEMHPPESILNAPKDYRVNVSERFKYYGGLMCFLGKRDSESHRILMLTLRQPLHKTYRFRSEAGDKYREDKKRAWKEKQQENKTQRQSSKGAKGRSRPQSQGARPRPRRESPPAREESPVPHPRARYAEPERWTWTGTWQQPQGWNSWAAWTWSAAYGWHQAQGASTEDVSRFVAVIFND